MDDHSINDQHPINECHDNDECSLPKPQTETPQPTTTPSTPPAVERRRRRLQQNAAAARREYAQTIHSHEYRYLWWDGSILAGVLGLLVFILLLQKDKIIQDIRHSKTRKHSSQIVQLSILLLKQLVVSPILYIQQRIFHIANTICRAITHPLSLPQEIWDLLALFMGDCQWACGTIYRNVFGNSALLEVGTHHEKGGGKADDLLPELEEEVDGVDKEDGLQQQQQQQQYEQLSQQNRVEKKRIRYDIDELPPAFLSEDRYPPGWLVYHPVYGVMTLEKLLELDKNKSL